MMLMKNSNTMDMCSGPLMKKLATYCVPLVVTGILQLLFNAADIIVVGRFAGRTALAAVGATTFIINLLVNLFMMMSIGVSVAVARHYGAHEFEDVEETVSTAMVFSAIVGLGVGLFGMIVAKKLLMLTDTPGDVLDQATTYMRIYFTGIPGFMVYNFGAAALRAVGDTQRPMQFLTIAGVVNVILNIVTVIGFRMGVAGVAIATSISQYVSASFIMLSLIRADGFMHFDVKRARIYRDKLVEIIRIGLPAGLQSAIFSISNVMIQSSINSFGASVLAGSSASHNLEGFVYTAMNSITQAATAFTGQNMGARKYDRIMKIWGNCLLLVLLVGGGMSLLLAMYAEGFISLYASDPEVLYWGARRLVFMCSAQYVMGLVDVTVGVLRGVGRSTLPMLISIFGICVLRVLWICTVFRASPTFITLLTGYPISWITTMLAQFICLFVIKKRMLDPLVKGMDMESAI